ncbi:phage portal protein [Brevundimonas sp.]|uniref:phage portal protein n=1 Tax=Brevundimonas sp. TaxID=1871086 RepID=UPI002EDABD74
MNLFDRLRGKDRTAAGVETRSANIENPTVPVSSANFLEFFGVDTGPLPTVTLDEALRVPAFGSAVAFLSRSLANLPLHAYRKKAKGSAERLPGKLQAVLNEAPNAEWTSFGLRQYFWQQVFTRGRGLMWIERQGSTVVALWPMDAAKTTVSRKAGRKVYTYEGKTYPAADVIDVPFMLRDDQLRVRSPLYFANDAIVLARRMARYSGGFFKGGGVPPLALTGPLPAGADAMARALRDQQAVIKAAQETGSQIFPVAPGYELKPVGFDPAKGQMTEAMKFVIEEIARSLNMPPVFVGDLTHGTFSNTEQQDLHLVKHLLAQWAKALEEEVNLKVFGLSNGGRYVEHNLDAVQRGVLKDRIEAYARAIQTSQMQPDEARALENRPPDPSGAGGKLYIQGATVPLGTQPVGTTNNGGADDPGNPDPEPKG